MGLIDEATNPEGHPFAGPAIPGRVEPHDWPPQTSTGDVGGDPHPLPPRAEQVGAELFFSRPVVGFQAWDHENDGLTVEEGGGWRLRPGVNTAQCPVGLDHDAPAAECVCGFAAVHDPAYLASFAGRVGLVAARGRILIHHHGFRAEEIVPLALAVDEEDRQPPSYGSTRDRQIHEQYRRRLERLSHRYSIPLCGEGSLARRAAVHGQLIHYADLPDLPVEPTEPAGLLKRLLGRADT